LTGLGGQRVTQYDEIKRIGVCKGKKESREGIEGLMCPPGTCPNLDWPGGSKKVTQYDETKRNGRSVTWL